MRRASGSFLAAWLLATVSALGVAWLGVHPVADLRLAERPPVPQPRLASSPELRADDGVDTGVLRNDSRNTSPQHTEPAPPPSPSDEPSLPSLIPSPTPRAGLPSPVPIPPTSTRPVPSGSYTPPDTVYREATTDGGKAAFEYVRGQEVHIVQAEPKPGWEVNAYRYFPDWVVVEFVSYDHRSTLHAYIEAGEARVDVVEEPTG